MKKHLALLFLLGAATSTPSTAADSELYRVLTIRAAPGELDAWLDACAAIRSAYERRGDRPPFILRHTQGDQWDFMFIEPWGSFEAYLDPKRLAKREAASEGMALLRHWLDDAPAFREDLFAVGPPREELRKLFAESRFYHVEMFYALPYQRGALLEQRRMENDYLARTGQPTNTVWIGISGSDVDVFTIGFHRDHVAFASGSSLSEEARDAAAREAGFEGLDQIGAALRSLISAHHDTLAVPVD